MAPRRRALPALLAAALLTVATLLVPALPAAAHDELVSTDPSADAVLDALPDRITFTFSADILPDQGATVIEVTDSAGASLASGAPTVDGSTVTQTLTGSASGPVSVLWRVVSSDGHPIDGSFSFAVPAASPTPAPTPTPTSAPTPSASATVTPSAIADPVATPSDTEQAASPLPWILLAVALLAVVGALVYLVTARGRGRSTGDRSAGTPGR